MKEMTAVVGGIVMAASLAATGLAQASAPAEAGSAPPAQKSWTDSVQLKGDLRYRAEWIDDKSKLDRSGNDYTEERERIRARFGAEAKPNDNTKVAIRFSTGGLNPNSANQTLGDGESRKEPGLELGYIDYSFLGKDPNELHAVGGKMVNPFITMPNDLVWDPDVNPDGIAFKGQLNGDAVTLMANAGYIWLQERASTSDTLLYAGQGAAKIKLASHAALTVGATYYGFQNTKGVDVVDWQGKNNAYGNSTKPGSASGGTTNKAWASDFTPVMGFGQLDLAMAGVPVSFFIEEMKNVDADTSFDQGQLYGVKLGKAKDPGSFEVGYSYAKLEKDATIGTLADDDRWGGGTDGSGSFLTGNYQIMKNLQAGVNYYFGAHKTISNSAKETDYSRLMLQVIASF